MIDAQVTDLLAESGRRIAARRRKSIGDVHARAAPDRFHRWDGRRESRAQGFPARASVSHFEVLRMTAKARRVIHDLFSAFISDPRLLPPQYQAMAAAGTTTAGDGRLHCRHDRPLLDEGASAPVRRRRVLNLPRVVAALQRIEIHGFWRYI
jgi:dGTPase